MQTPAPFITDKIGHRFPECWTLKDILEHTNLAWLIEPLAEKGVVFGAHLFGRRVDELFTGLKLPEQDKKQFLERVAFYGYVESHKAGPVHQRMLDETGHRQPYRPLQGAQQIRRAGERLIAA